MASEGAVTLGARCFALAGCAVVLAACAGRSEVVPPARPSAPVAVINAPPSARGNPSNYEVLGKRYYVLKTSEGYRERGIASWYGPDFHGLSTASGEPYDMYALTAAHKTLPIPTWVEVTNLDNGKHVIVKINDRGPFVADRIIDLSYSAAKALDMIGQGTARVEVRALGVSSAAPISGANASRQTQARNTEPPAAPRAAPPAPSTSRGGSFSLIRSAEASTLGADAAAPPQLYVQVGAFADRNNAERLRARLTAAGFASTFIDPARERRRSLYRVRIGPLVAAGDYERMRPRLRAMGIADTRLIAGQKD